MAKADVVAIGSEGERAYERVRPLVEAAKEKCVKALIAIGNEYRAISSEKEKLVFCKRLGKDPKSIQDIATAARRLPKIKDTFGPDRSGRLDDFDMTHIIELGRTPTSTLKKAISAGMFDEGQQVSKRDIAKLRKTGQVPTPVVRQAPKTPLNKIKSLMVRAEEHIRKASGDISEITALMYDNDVTNAKGREARALIQSFEKLCLEISAANPKTSKRAFAILRGEA